MHGQLKWVYGGAARRAAAGVEKLGRVGRIFNAENAPFGRIVLYAGKLAVAGTVLTFGLAAHLECFVAERGHSPIHTRDTQWTRV